MILRPEHRLTADTTYHSAVGSVKSGRKVVYVGNKASGPLQAPFGWKKSTGDVTSKSRFQLSFSKWLSSGRIAAERKLIDSRPLRLFVNIPPKRCDERGSRPWIAASWIAALVITIRSNR
jgi:hypothetical protein